MDSPLAMISYSWVDSDAAELLHDELALRGFAVIHDKYCFTDGSRIPANMSNAVEHCDVFVAYLTPNSLYLNKDPGQPRPTLTGELKPALRRRRQNLQPGASDTPVVLPVSHGLGDRAVAAETIRQHTGENIASLWTTWIDQATAHITQPEAAIVSAHALTSLANNPPCELFVATRGTAPPPVACTVDATRLLGGDRTSGEPADWARLQPALRDVEQHLSANGPGHNITIDLRCHLSAALATGRVFHQATRWSPTFATRGGPTQPTTADPKRFLNGNFDHCGEAGDLIVDIDLLGHNVADLTNSLAAELPPAGGRISLTRSRAHGDLPTDEIAHAARWSANLIRSAHATLRPSTIHITQAAPAAFAGLLGHHLTALNADIVTYELDHYRYTSVLTIPHIHP